MIGLVMGQDADRERAPTDPPVEPTPQPLLLPRDHGRDEVTPLLLGGVTVVGGLLLLGLLVLGLLHGASFDVTVNGMTVSGEDTTTTYEVACAAPAQSVATSAGATTTKADALTGISGDAGDMVTRHGPDASVGDAAAQVAGHADQLCGRLRDRAISLGLLEGLVGAELTVTGAAWLRRLRGSRNTAKVLA